MKDLKLFNDVMEEVRLGNVNTSIEGELILFKYSVQCVQDNAWNDTNRQCRGLIMKSDGTIVARPFAKFFNINEREETQFDALPWDQPHEVWEKHDGSCGIGYQKDGQWHLATPGSMASDQALHGTAMLSGYDTSLMPDGVTPVFEIVYPENRIVVDYKGRSFLSLLAIFEHSGSEWKSQYVDIVAKRMNLNRPRRFDAFDTFEENFEGYVIKFDSGMRVKIKSQDYVKIHRLLEYCSPRRVLEMIRTGNFEEIVAILPDSLKSQFDDIASGLRTEFRRQHELCLSLFSAIPTNLETRKDFALHVQSSMDSKYWSFMFQLYGNQDITENVWKKVLGELNES